MATMHRLMHKGVERPPEEKDDELRIHSKPFLKESDHTFRPQQLERLPRRYVS